MISEIIQSKIFLELLALSAFVLYIYPPTQKTTGLPVDECEHDVFCFGDVRPYLEKVDRYPAKGGVYEKGPRL